MQRQAQEETEDKSTPRESTVESNDDEPTSESNRMPQPRVPSFDGLAAMASFPNPGTYVHQDYNYYPSYPHGPYFYHGVSYSMDSDVHEYVGAGGHPERETFDASTQIRRASDQLSASDRYQSSEHPVTSLTLVSSSEHGEASSGVARSPPAPNRASVTHLPPSTPPPSALTARDPHPSDNAIMFDPFHHSYIPLWDGVYPPAPSGHDYNADSELDRKPEATTFSGADPGLEEDKPIDFPGHSVKASPVARKPKKKVVKKSKSRKHTHGRLSDSSTSSNETGGRPERGGGRSHARLYSHIRPSQEELEEAHTERAREALYSWHERLRDLCQYRDVFGHSKYILHDTSSPLYTAPSI